MWAFDCLGEICFSTKLGFLDTCSDVDGIIADVREKLWLGTIMAHVRWLSSIITGLSTRLLPTHPIVRFCAKCIDQRVSEDSKQKCNGAPDFLARCHEAQRRHPDIVTDDLIRSWYGAFL